MRCQNHTDSLNLLVFVIMSETFSFFLFPNVIFRMEFNWCFESPSKIKVTNFDDYWNIVTFHDIFFEIIHLQSGLVEFHRMHLELNLKRYLFLIKQWQILCDTSFLIQILKHNIILFLFLFLMPLNFFFTFITDAQ